MNCYECGAEMGAALGLCEACRKRRTPDLEAIQAGTIPKSPENHLIGLTYFLSTWTGMAIMFIVGLVGAFAYVAVTFGEAPLLSQVFYSLAIVFGFVSAFAYIKIWIESGLEDPIISVLSLLLGIGVYRMVLSYPERNLKPFCVHIVALVMAGSCYFAG